MSEKTTGTRVSAYQRLKRRMMGRTPSSEPYGISSNKVEQRGVTLQEVLIGIAVAAVVAAASIALGVQFIGSGQESAARSSLETALVVTESNYSRIVPGGGNNFVGESLTGITDAAAAERGIQQQYTLLAVARLNSLGEDLRFIPWLNSSASSRTSNQCTEDGDFGTTAVNGGNTNGTTGQFLAAYQSIPRPTSGPTCVDNTGAAINKLNEKDVWVQVLDKDTTEGPKAGGGIRLGSRAANGSTICVIAIKGSTDNAILGRGWQAVNATHSATASQVADCGMLNSPQSAASDETPNSTGTDASLGDATAKTY